MKINELFETKKPGSEPVKYDVQLPGIKSNPEDGIELMKKHASDAMWMLETKRPIYRGIGRKITDDISIADPSKSERVSSNTMNYYTIILDNHPEMKDFPKRSKSFIASTNIMRAAGYASDEYNQLYVLIPFNGVKIGIVPEEDIWDVTVNFLGQKIGIEEMNTSFDTLDVLSRSIDDIETFAEKIKNDTRRYVLFAHEFKSSKITDYKLWNARQDLMKVIWDAYSPKHTRLTVETTATMDRTLPNNEVWIGGKCLCIRYLFWKNMVIHNDKV